MQDVCDHMTEHSTDIAYMQEVVRLVHHKSKLVV